MVGRSLGVLLLLLATACGGSTAASGAAGAGGSDAGAEASAGGGGSPGFDAGDVYTLPWADSGPIDAGVFDCNGVCCDGTTHYCRLVGGGGPAPVFGTPPEAGPVTCSDAGTSNWCVPLPSACGGVPSCACLGIQPNSACTCADTGGGITETCVLP